MKDFIRDYQTLITGVLAVIIGFVTIYFLWKQIHISKERDRKSAFSLAMMFCQEIKIIARFLYARKNIILGIITANDKSAFESWDFPDRPVFSSQSNRLAELDPEIASRIMYLNQTILILEKFHQDAKLDGMNKHLMESMSELYKLCYEKTLDCLVLLESVIKKSDQDSDEIKNLREFLNHLSTIE